MRDTQPKRAALLSKSLAVQHGGAGGVDETWKGFRSDTFARDTPKDGGRRSQARDEGAVAHALRRLASVRGSELVAEASDPDADYETSPSLSPSEAKAVGLVSVPSRGSIVPPPSALLMASVDDKLEIAALPPPLVAPATVAAVTRTTGGLAAGSTALVSKAERLAETPVAGGAEGAASPALARLKAASASTAAAVGAGGETGRSSATASEDTPEGTDVVFRSTAGVSGTTDTPASGAPPMVNVQAFIDAPVGGISVVRQLEVNAVPIMANLTSRLIKDLIAFFAPEAEKEASAREKRKSAFLGKGASGRSSSRSDATSPGTADEDVSAAAARVVASLPSLGEAGAAPGGADGDGGVTSPSSRSVSPRVGRRGSLEWTPTTPASTSPASEEERAAVDGAARPGAVWQTLVVTLPAVISADQFELAITQASAASPPGLVSDVARSQRRGSDSTDGTGPISSDGSGALDPARGSVFGGGLASVRSTDESRWRSASAGETTTTGDGLADEDDEQPAEVNAELTVMKHRAATTISWRYVRLGEVVIIANFRGDTRLEDVDDVELKLHARKSTASPQRASSCR